MAGMTRVARGRPELRPVLAQVSNLGGCLQADFVATPATFFSFDHGHRLPMDGRHGLHRGPSHGVLALLELLDLCLMASCACIRRRDFDFCNIVGCLVLIAVARDATHLHLTMFAQLPVGNDVGRHLAVTIHTTRTCRWTLSGYRDDGEEKNDSDQ